MHASLDKVWVGFKKTRIYLDLGMIYYDHAYQFGLGTASGEGV